MIVIFDVKVAGNFDGKVAGNFDGKVAGNFDGKVAGNFTTVQFLICECKCVVHVKFQTGVGQLKWF